MFDFLDFSDQVPGDLIDETKLAEARAKTTIEEQKGPQAEVIDEVDFEAELTQLEQPAEVDFEAELTNLTQTEVPTPTGEVGTTDMGIAPPKEGLEEPIVKPTEEELKYQAMPLYEKVGSNTVNILKTNVGRFGSLINAGAANLNEAIGVDSKLYRENQAFWQGISNQAITELEPAYGEKEGWKMIVAKEFGNPLNAMLLNSLATMTGVVGVDVAGERAVSPRGEQGADMQDVNAVALGMGAGAVIGKLIEPTMRVLGNAGSAILDMWRLRGLPDNIKLAIKSGNDKELERILRELKISDDIGAGDLPFGGKSSTTTNILEARRATGETGIVAQVERNSVRQADSILSRAKSTEVSAEALYEAVQHKAKTLKEPMKAAYDNSLKKASKTPQHDMTVTNQSIIDELKEGGAPDPVINYVMKQLYSKERHITPDQRKVQKAVKAAETKLDDLSNEYILGGSTNKNLEKQITALENNIGGMKKTLPDDSPYYSELDIINAVRGITYKTDTAGADIGQADEKAQYFLDVARRSLGDKAGSLFETTGSPIYKEFQRANSLAVKYYKYSTGMNEIQQVLSKGQVLPEETLTNLMNNPVRLKQLIELTGDKELGQELVNQTLAHTMKPKTQAIAGSLDKLDMKATSKMLDTIFADKKLEEFFGKYLTKTQFNNVKGFRNVIASFDTMTDSLPPSQTLGQYLTGAEGTLNTAGRFIKVMYDGLGYAKNSLLDLGGIKKFNSRIYPNTKVISQATRIITRRLNKQGPAAPEGYQLPNLTPAETKIVNKAMEALKGILPASTSEVIR